jgi:hypothetical protein
MYSPQSIYMVTKFRQTEIQHQAETYQQLKERPAPSQPNVGGRFASLVQPLRQRVGNIHFGRSRSDRSPVLKDC